MRKFINWLFDSNYGLTRGQKLALGKLYAGVNDWRNSRNRAIAEGLSRGLEIDRQSLDMADWEFNEQIEFTIWRIRNYPEEIRDDGTFKSKYYKNNKLVRMI